MNWSLIPKLFSVSLLLVLLVSLGCTTEEQKGQWQARKERREAEKQERLQNLVQTALENTNVQILRKQLEKIPEGTPDRERVVLHLEALRAKEHAAASQEQARLQNLRKKVLSSLKSEKDEFQDATFYKHPGTPTLGTQTYLYIVQSGDTYVLRLVATYEGDSWVFWDTLLVKSGDDPVVTLNAGNSVKKDNSSGTVWETVDMPVSSSSLGAGKLDFNSATGPVFAVIMRAASSSIRFQGKHVHDHKLSKAELARFKDVGTKFMTLASGKE